MASLSNFLPPPKNISHKVSNKDSKNGNNSSSDTQSQDNLPLDYSFTDELLNPALSISKSESYNSNVPSSIKPDSKTTNIPKYGFRSNWIPKLNKDFADGGAYPEIHTLQYPLNMGLNVTSNSNNKLSLQVRSDGSIDYGKLTRYGHSKDRLVQAEYKDSIPLIQRSDNTDNIDVPKPSDREALETMQKTEIALDMLVKQKTKASQPSRYTNKTSDPVYIRYTPKDQSCEDNNKGEIKQRIIRIVDKPRDPLEPPKFKHKKIPGNPGSPPHPVLHSPTRKVTHKEQQDWIVPPCISNWKNPKGYTIPLDKRLAADGRGLQDIQINNKFAALSEALFTAERLAREEVSKRQNYRVKLQENERVEKEEQLRKLAMEARNTSYQKKESNISAETTAESPKNRDENTDFNNDISYKQRERIRREKQKEREYESKMAKMGKDKKIKLIEKNNHENRDISERVALGVAKPTMNSKESMFDARLFNQAEGIGSGFKDEEAYNIYDKSLFQGSSTAKNIYRPSREEEDINNNANLDEIMEQQRFGTALGESKFKGVSNNNKNVSNSGPVKFEKASTKEIRQESEDEDQDPFGLDAFLNEAKKGKDAFKDK